MAKKSKNYRAAVEKIGDGAYAPYEAFEMLKEVASAKFDETVEVHFRLGIDTRKADQNLRGTVALPNGSGKTVRVAVFAEGDAARAAEEAGADIVGSDDLVADIQAGNMDFDAAVATPDQMSKVGSELRHGIRRDSAHEAVVGQGQVREVDYRCFDHEPGHHHR